MGLTILDQNHIVAVSVSKVTIQRMKIIKLKIETIESCISINFARLMFTLLDTFLNPRERGLMHCRTDRFLKQI